MRVEFLSIAEEEFAEAVDYYNDQSKGLGFEFAAEVKHTLERIIEFPNAWSPLSRRSRRCLLNRFPFGIIYQIRPDNILIVALMNLQREPNSWKKRIEAE